MSEAVVTACGGGEAVAETVQCVVADALGEVFDNSSLTASVSPNAPHVGK